MPLSESAQPLLGQIALVTGATSGLGRATALALAGAGADVGLIGRSEPELEQVASAITGSGRRALPVPLDLADEVRIHTSVTQLTETFGGVDLLVNAAGTDVPGPVEALDSAGWDRVLAVNLRAPFLLARAVFPHMREQARGTIVNVSSVAGKRGWANASAYCASKFGLTGLTQALAAEGKPHGIRACVLYPGAMATSWGVWSPADRATEQRDSQPPTEALPPEQVASLIVWIATAPPELVLNEAVVSPLEEQGWP